MKEIIKSRSNSLIKHIKSLQIKKYRDEYGEFVIEGEKLISEALGHGISISYVFTNQSCEGKEGYSALMGTLDSKSIPQYYAGDAIFKEICETETPQGVIAVAKKLEFDLEEVVTRDELYVVLLHEIRDPGNAGTIIRTADACGLDAVLFSIGSVDLYNGKTIRATMGSLFHIPVFQNIDAAEVISVFRDNKVVTIGADPHSSTSCIELPYYNKSAIIIGNESQGLDGGIQAALDYKVKIPMPGKAESLNAGIAASILMYEFYVRKKH